MYDESNTVDFDETKKRIIKFEIIDGFIVAEATNSFGFYEVIVMTTQYKLCWSGNNYIHALRFINRINRLKSCKPLTITAVEPIDKTILSFIQDNIGGY